MVESVPEEMTPERRREAERAIVALTRLLPPYCELRIVIVDGWPDHCQLVECRKIRKPK